jgi:hypothetical protein
MLADVTISVSNGDLRQSCFHERTTYTRTGMHALGGERALSMMVSANLCGRLFDPLRARWSSQPNRVRWIPFLEVLLRPR